MKQIHCIAAAIATIFTLEVAFAQLPVPVTEPLPQTTVITNTTETTLPELREFYYSQPKQQFRWVVGDWRRTLTVEEFYEAATAKNVNVEQLGIELGKIIDYIRAKDAAAQSPPANP